MAGRLRTFSGSGVPVTAIAVVPGGRFLAAADALSVSVWHAQSGERVWSRALSRTTLIEAAPDGSRILAAGPRAPIVILDVTTGYTLATGTTTPLASSWCANGELLHLSAPDAPPGAFPSRDARTGIRSAGG